MIQSCQCETPYAGARCNLALSRASKDSTQASEGVARAIAQEVCERDVRLALSHTSDWLVAHGS